jgi:hypothetical protein
MLELIRLRTGVANIPSADEQAEASFRKLDLLQLERHLGRRSDDRNMYAENTRVFAAVYIYM